MLDDVQALALFHETRLGRVATALLRRRLRAFWPELRGQRLLGLGYAAPVLPAWRDEAGLCVDALAAAPPPAASGRAECRCLVQDDALPFADGAFDRVLLMHAVETADATRLLRGVWRVLRDDGRLLIVVPNRTGLWALRDGTPFADGAPCSTGRIERLLRRSLFRIERLEGALFLPPLPLRPLLRAAPLLEAAGRHLSPRLSGVLLVEAVKDVHAAIPALAAARGLFGLLRRRLRRQVLAPAGRDAAGPGPA